MNAENFPFKPKLKRQLRFLTPWILLGICVHIVGFLLLRIEIASPKNIELPPPFVTWVSHDTDNDDYLVHEQSLLKDTSILFIPTTLDRQSIEWNLPERGDALRFPSIEPNIRLTSMDALQFLQAIHSYPISEPKDLLATRFWRLFDRLGLANLAAPDSNQIAFTGFQLSAWKNDAHAVVIEDTALPNYPDKRGRLLAAPLEIIFHIDERGLVGRPIRMNEPGNREFIDSVQSWLRNPALLYSLSSGTYSIRVFP